MAGKMPALRWSVPNVQPVGWAVPTKLGLDGGHSPPYEIDAKYEEAVYQVLLTFKTNRLFSRVYMPATCHSGLG